jgi:hypothetical protein
MLHNGLYLQNEVPNIELASTRMTRHSECFEAMEEAWRKRVESARERYLAAVTQTERVAQGGGARQQAHLIKGEALALYLGELRTFTDLVLKGKIPPGAR